MIEETNQECSRCDSLCDRTVVVQQFATVKEAGFSVTMVINIHIDYYTKCALQSSVRPHPWIRLVYQEAHRCIYCMFTPHECARA